MRSRNTSSSTKQAKEQAFWWQRWRDNYSYEGCASGSVKEQQIQFIYWRLKTWIAEEFRGKQKIIMSLQGSRVQSLVWEAGSESIWCRNTGRSARLDLKTSRTKKNQVAWKERMRGEPRQWERSKAGSPSMKEGKRESRKLESWKRTFKN